MDVWKMFLVIYLLLGMLNWSFFGASNLWISHGGGRRYVFEVSLISNCSSQAPPSFAAMQTPEGGEWCKMIYSEVNARHASLAIIQMPNTCKKRFYRTNTTLPRWSLLAIYLQVVSKLEQDCLTHTIENLCVFTLSCVVYLLAHVNFKLFKYAVFFPFFRRCIPISMHTLFEPPG